MEPRAISVILINMPKETTKKKTVDSKEDSIELSTEFANLGELLEARNGSSKGLSNQVSLEIAHRKGLYPYKDKMPSSQYEPVSYTHLTLPTIYSV